MGLAAFEVKGLGLEALGQGSRAAGLGCLGFKVRGFRSSQSRKTGMVHMAKAHNPASESTNLHQISSRSRDQRKGLGLRVYKTKPQGPKPQIRDAKARGVPEHFRSPDLLLHCGLDIGVVF